MDNAPSQTLKGSLLVVDDDLGARQTLSALLSQEGYETRCAPDGKTALMFQGRVPELILLDVRLPDLDGFEICRRLKESEKTGRIPVVFLSGLDELGDKMRGFELGGVDYIIKPFQAAEVLARVETHLALHRLRKQVENQNIVLEAVVQERTKELIDLTESLVREIVQRERADEALEERLRFERILSDLSARLVYVPSGRLDERNRERPEDDLGVFPGRALRTDSDISGPEVMAVYPRCHRRGCATSSPGKGIPIFDFPFRLRQTDP